MPWQIIPIWTELPTELIKLAVFQNFNVSTIIKYDNVERLQSELSKLFSDSQIVLFLRSKEVRIIVNSKEKFTIEKIKQGVTTKLKRNNIELSEWLIRTDTFDIPIDVQKEINADEKSPKKLKDATRTEISFAIQLEKGKLKAVEKENRLIFTYLPTSINYDFPFLVNASFLTDAGRQHLHQDIFWNNWIFKKIPLLFFAWVAELANKNSKYNKHFLAVIPHKLGNFPLEKSFNEGYMQAINSIAFVPNLKSDLLKISETIFDKTNISNFISKQTLINYINSKTHTHFSISSFVPYTEPISTLSRLGTKMFDIEDLEDFFASDIFKKEHQLNENFKLISFLLNQSEKNKDAEGKSVWNEKLRNTPFIFDENLELKSPKNIYFPSASFSKKLKKDISIINESVYQEISENEKMKSWLLSLGVEEPSSISFIEKTIINQGDEYININNAIEIGRYLFDSHVKGRLKPSHYNGLHNLKILTKQNSLIAAQDAFFSNFYKPTLELENIFDNDIYISENYFDTKNLISEWQAFWIKIGVNEKISWCEKIISRVDLQTKYEGYFNIIPSGNPHWNYPNDFYQYEINILSFIEQTTEYNFSKQFWKIVFNENLEIKIGNIDLGISYFNRLLPSLNDWIIKNNSIIPTSQRTCLNPTSVFNCGIPLIKEIGGKYLPILDYDDAIPPNWLEYLNLIQTVELDDYLNILEKIWQDNDISEEEQKENQKRIGLIYETLASMKLHNSEEEKIREWGETNKLLARSGTDFFYPKELSIVTIDGFTASNLAYPSINNFQILELLRLFGVTIIDKVKSTISNSTVEIKDLKNKLSQASPLVALVAVEKSKNRKAWETEFKRINDKLQDITFFQTSEIYLSYGNDADKQKRSSWAEGNDFYYVGNWYSPRILDGLIEPLGKFLNIRYAERILTVLLLENFVGGVEYLTEKGYDISLIPNKLLNPKESRTVFNEGNTPYNPDSESLGKLGEQFVYEELKRIYSKKYNTGIEETKTGFKIENKLEVFWRNISENTTANHDFKIIEIGKETYIDSKATPYAKNVEKVALYISGPELNLMEHSSKYLIARVYDVTKESKKMELVQLKIGDLKN